MALYNSKNVTRKTAVFIFPLIFLFLGHLQKSPVNGVVVAAVIGKDIYFSFDANIPPTADSPDPSP